MTNKQVVEKPNNHGDLLPWWIASLISAFLVGMFFGYLTWHQDAPNIESAQEVNYDTSKYYQDGVDTVGWKTVLQVRMLSSWQDAWVQDAAATYESMGIETRTAWRPETKPRLQEWVVPKLTKRQAKRLQDMLGREADVPSVDGMIIWADSAGVVHFDTDPGITIFQGE